MAAIEASRKSGEIEIHVLLRNEGPYEFLQWVVAMEAHFEKNQVKKS